MICPTCRFLILDNKGCCNLCGRLACHNPSLNENQNPPFSDLSPEHFFDIGFSVKGFLPNNEYRTGFFIYFQLLDNRGNITRGTGDLLIKLRWTLFGSIYRINTYIKKEDFSQSLSDPEWYGYKFTFIKPILKPTIYRTKIYDYWVELEFRETGSKKILKGSNRSSWNIGIPTFGGEFRF